jgi:arginase
MPPDVCLVEVPFMCGDAGHPAAEGPSRAAAALGREGGCSVAAAPDAQPGTIAASLAVDRGVARCIRDAVARGETPLVLAGSCDAAIGVVAGLDRPGLGVVWLDAHGDFNTPESSVSGFLPGMSLAIVAGHCHEEVWAQLGGGRPVRESDIALLGVRDLSPAAERERLHRSDVRVVAWRDGAAERAVSAVLQQLSSREIYLHIDLDALDPHVAPGVVDDPVPGGLTLEDATAIVRAVRERFAIRAAAITTYVPARDRDDRTLRAIVRLSEVIAG